MLSLDSEGWYIFMFNHWDSYPEGLGFMVLNLIPSDQEEFVKWLRAMRTKLDTWLLAKGVIKENEVSQHITDGVLEAQDSDFVMAGEYARFELDRHPPENDLFIEWTYEIDLDNKLLRVNDSTTFPLDHRPSPEEFLSLFSRCTSQDGFEGLPSQALTPASKEDLAFYDEHIASAGVKHIDELLDTSKSLTQIEDTRLALLEVVVGKYLKSNGGMRLFFINTYPDRHSLGPDTQIVEDSLCLLDIALSPPIFGSTVHRHKAHKNNLALVWLRVDTCVWLSVRLDHLESMKAAISQLVSEVLTTMTKRGLVFGVVFSLSHIVLVTIDTSSGTFQHTPSLQFLPSSYAMSPCTPGIVALARVACRPDPSFAWGMVKGVSSRIRGAPTPELEIDLGEVQIIELWNATAQRLPNELWSYIAGFVFETTDLIHLAKVSRQCRNAAMLAICSPRISDIILTKRAASLVGEHQLAEKFNEESPDFVSLCFASFEVYTPNEQGKPLPTRLTLGPTRFGFNPRVLTGEGSNGLEKALGGGDFPLHGILYGDEYGALSSFSYVLF